MSLIDELLNDVEAAGIRLRLDPPDLVAKPAERLTPELKARLKAHKAEILDRLKLQETLRQLEAAGVSVAVWDDGSMRVVVTEAEAVKAINDGGIIYSAEDMHYYVMLTEPERRMLYDFKRRYGGSVEWKMKP